MLTKDKVIERIKNLPSAFLLDELIDELIFVEKVENGLKQSEGNKVVSEEELDKKVEKWFE